MCLKTMGKMWLEVNILAFDSKFEGFSVITMISLKQISELKRFVFIMLYFLFNNL